MRKFLERKFGWVWDVGGHIQVAVVFLFAPSRSRGEAELQHCQSENARGHRRRSEVNVRMKWSIVCHFFLGEHQPISPLPPTVNEPSPEELLRQLQEERTCKVCMDKLVSIVFIPCGHLVVCGDCAASLRHCPICRAVIRGSVRAFMS